MLVPHPHPLDFDWRYTGSTVKALVALLPPEQPILAIGAPTLARALEAQGRDVLLIDRQPLQGVSNQMTVEVGEPIKLPTLFKFAVIDPPWYLHDTKLWFAWTASLLGDNGVILGSIWPPDVRPTELIETDELIGWLRAWADTELLPTTLVYERPHFEAVASDAASGTGLSASPLRGRLLRVQLRRQPPTMIPLRADDVWSRFILDDYQIGIRLKGRDHSSPKMEAHPNAVGWIWPYVSKRAPNRNSIDIWSSENEVAIVYCPRLLADALKHALQKPEEFEIALRLFPQLLDWKIPRPPYKRVVQWTHRY